MLTNRIFNVPAGDEDGNGFVIECSIRWCDKTDVVSRKGIQLGGEGLVRPTASRTSKSAFLNRLRRVNPRNRIDTGQVEYPA